MPRPRPDQSPAPDPQRRPAGEPAPPPVEPPWSERPSSSSTWARARWRRRRFTRFRVTAEPTALETTKPTAPPPGVTTGPAAVPEGPSALSPATGGRARRESVGPLAPRAAPCVGSPPTDASVRARVTRGRPGCRAVRQTACRGPCAGGRQGWRVRTRVRIRRRNPWTRLRRRLLGWNVRLLTGGLPISSDHGQCTARRIAGSEQGSPQWRRPPNGTGSDPRGSNRPRRPAIVPTQCPADTPSDQEKCHERVAARPSPLLRSRLVPSLSFRQRSSARHHQFHPMSPPRCPPARARCVPPASVVAVVSTHPCTGCG